MSKISQYTAIASPAANDLLVVVDVDDPSMAASGTTKNMTLAQMAAVQPVDVAPTGLTGATAASRYAGATTSGAPVSGTFAVGDFVIDQSGKAWICTVAGTPGTWAQVGTSLPLTTLGDSLYEGSSGLARLAGNTTTTRMFWRQQGTGSASAAPAWDTLQIGDIPYQPWQFTPEAYGAKRNGKILVDASITSGFAILTSPSAPFTSADVTKSIVVPSAGGFLNVPLVTTIASYQSPTQVTLAANATRTVTTGGALYGTDDTAAIQSAINAAVTYAQSGKSAFGEVVFGDGIYCVAGAPGGTNMNAQIQLPNIASPANVKVNLKLTGALEAMGPTHWLDPVPPVAGTVLFSVYYADSSSPLTPPQCVLGGPVTGCGGAGGTFSNLRVIVDGLNILVPYRASISGLDLFGVAQADVRSFSYFCLAQPVGASGSVWPPYIGGAGNPSPWQVFGYRTPTTGNNAQNSLGKLTVYGPYHCVVFADHFAAQEIAGIYNIAASTAAGIGTGVSHHCVIQSLISEGTNLALYNPNDGVLGNGASQAVTIMSCQVESASFIIDDPANSLYGEVHAESLGATGVITNGKSGAANIRLIWDYQPLGVVASPPAVPLTVTALRNTFYRDATVYITSGGAAVTVIAVDGVTTGATLGSTGTVAVRVPNGQTITLTYASTAPTWAWVLE